MENKTKIYKCSMFLRNFLDDEFEWNDFVEVVHNYVYHNEILPLQDFIGMHLRDDIHLEWITSIGLIDAMDAVVESSEKDAN